MSGSICSPNSFSCRELEHYTVLGKAGKVYLYSCYLVDPGVLRDTELWTFHSMDFSHEFQNCYFSDRISSVLWEEKRTRWPCGVSLVTFVSVSSKAMKTPCLLQQGCFTFSTKWEETRTRWPCGVSLVTFVRVSSKAMRTPLQHEVFRDHHLL